MYAESEEDGRSPPPMRMPEPALVDPQPDGYAYANEDSYSPRSELLSTPPGGRHTQKHKHNRTKTKPSTRYRKDRERHHAHEPHHELLRLLIDREYEADKLRRALDEASRRIDNEAQRAAEAERVARETLHHVRLAGEARATAQADASRTRDELAMYRVQVTNAQREIDRAQDVVRSLERQRDDAERTAARARSTARRLTRELLAEAAREEGRRLGFRDGLRQARAEAVVEHPRRRRRHHQPRRRHAPTTDTEEEAAFEDEYDYPYESEYDYEAAFRNTPRRHEETLASSPGRMPIRTVDAGQISPETSTGPPQPSPHPLSPPRTRISYPTTGAPTEPFTEQPPAATPVLEHPEGRSPAGYVPPQMRTPGIQTYSLEIPSAEEVEREINPPRPMRRGLSNTRRHGMQIQPQEMRRVYETTSPQGGGDRQPIYTNPLRREYEDEDDGPQAPPPSGPVQGRTPEEILAAARRIAEQERQQLLAQQEAAAAAREREDGGHGGGGLFSTLKRALTGKGSRKRPGLQRNLSVIEEQSTPSSARRGHLRSQSENVVPRAPYGRDDISPDIAISVQPPSHSETTPSKATPSREGMSSREHLPRSDGYLSPRTQPVPMEYTRPVPHTPGGHYEDDWAAQYTPEQRHLIDTEGWKGLLDRTVATPNGAAVRGGPPLPSSSSSSRMRPHGVNNSSSSSRAGGAPRRMRPNLSSRGQPPPPQVHAPRPSAPVAPPPVPFSPASAYSGLRGSSMTTKEHQMAFKHSPSLAFPPLPPLAPTTSAEPTTRPGSAMSRRSARSLRSQREADVDRDRARQDAEDHARLASELHRPSSRGSAYGHYDPSTYVDPALVRSTEDLTLPPQATTPRSRAAEVAATPRSRQRALSRSRDELRSPRSQPRADPPPSSRASEAPSQGRSQGTSDDYGAETELNTRANAAIRASSLRSRGGDSTRGGTGRGDAYRGQPPPQQPGPGMPYAGGAQPYGAPLGYRPPPNPQAYGQPRAPPVYPYAAAAPPSGYAQPPHPPASPYAPHAVPGGMPSGAGPSGGVYGPPPVQNGRTSPFIPDRPPSRSSSPTPVPVPPPQPQGPRRERSQTSYTDLDYAE